VAEQPPDGLASGQKELRQTISDAIALRGFYIAGPDELCCVSAGKTPEEARDGDLLEQFAERNGWAVTIQRRLRAALFQITGHEVLAPEIWMAATGG
jgi:hypothetical protein